MLVTGQSCTKKRLLNWARRLCIVAPSEVWLSIAQKCRHSLSEIIDVCLSFSPNSDHNTLGKRGESIATKFLRKNGILIWKRNWKCRYGELDLIGIYGRELVIAEVRTRRSDLLQDIDALGSIDQAKRNQLIKLVQIFVIRNRKSMLKHRIKYIRIDLIGVRLGKGWRSLYSKPTIDYLRGVYFLVAKNIVAVNQ